MAAKLKNPFRRRVEVEEVAPEPVEPRRFSVGDGVRAYAIGDVHGELDRLRELFRLIAEDFIARGGVGQPHIIQLGDMIDRGPDARGVIDFLLEFGRRMPHLHCLMGNHEEVFAMALRGNLDALRFFLRIGGRETLLSYGLSEKLVDGGDTPNVLIEMLQAVPEAHRNFILNLPSSYSMGDYLFVHAGIRPGVPAEVQSLEDLHWIREDFLSSRVPHPQMVVHGHTPTDAVDEQPNRIGIDTGACYGGSLTALGLNGEDRWYLSA